MTPTRNRTDLLADKIGNPRERRTFWPERLPMLVFFCLLWTAEDTPWTFAQRTGMPLAKVQGEITHLRGYLGIEPGGPRRAIYVLTYAFLELHAPEEVAGLPVPDPDLPPPPNKRSPTKSLSETFGAFLADLRSKERLDQKAQEKSGDEG